MSNTTTERETFDLKEIKLLSLQKVEELRSYLSKDFVSVTVITGGGEKSVLAQMSYGRATLHLCFATYGEAVMLHPECVGALDYDDKWRGHLRL
jgi:hypothetical protein